MILKYNCKLCNKEIEKLQCMLDNSVNIITKTEIKPYLLYCKTKNINLQEFKIKYV